MSEHEADVLDEAGLQRVWRGVVHTRARRVRGRRLAAACAATAVVSALAGWWVGSMTRGSSSVEPALAGPTAGGRPLEAVLATTAGPLALDDGSSIVPGPGVRLSVLESSVDALALLLGEGRAQIDVRPQAGRRWLIECGVATVEVRDGVAEIVRVGSRVEVRVERGSALVRSDAVADRVRRVDAPGRVVIEGRRIGPAEAAGAQGGAGLEVAEEGPHAAAGSGAASGVAALAAGSRSAGVGAAGSDAAGSDAAGSDAAGAGTSRGRLSGAAGPSGGAVGSPAARADLTDGPAPAFGAHARAEVASIRGARGAVPGEIAGPTSPVDPASTAEAAGRAVAPRAGSAGSGAPPSLDPAVVLLARADRARAAGDPAGAAVLLEQLVREHPAHPTAPHAAFDLARLELDALARPARAVVALERALSLGLPSALAEDAHARLVEAHARAGDVASARRVAADHRRTHPAGRRLADVDRWSPR